MVRRYVRWRLLLLLDAHQYFFQRPVVRDSIHGENMLYTYSYSYANATRPDAESDSTSANADSTSADADP